MTGRRQGELLALRWSDIDWAAGRVRVAESFTRGAFDSSKSHRGRSADGRPARRRDRAPLPALALPGDHHLVFAHPATGRVLDAPKVHKRFRAALARAGVPDLTFHELRHTFGTHMPAAGALLRAMQGGGVTLTPARPRSTPTTHPTRRAGPSSRRKPSAPTPSVAAIGDAASGKPQQAPAP